MVWGGWGGLLEAEMLSEGEVNEGITQISINNRIMSDVTPPSPHT